MQRNSLTLNVLMDEAKYFLPKQLRVAVTQVLGKG